MALRKIVTIGDELLNKKCRKVEKFDDRLHDLLDDMLETLENANGVGLAAIQVGILRRVAIILIDDELIELINPEIIETSGEQDGQEGCLSVPRKFGDVLRPNYVKVKAQDRNGNEFTVSGTGLKARAFCHEIEHLDGHLFVEKARNLHEPDND